jgi:UDP-N-acetylglucosamine:LPS N-acetylglucosamine transferase
LRLRAAWQEHEVCYVTVGPCDASKVQPAELRLIPDANRNTPLRMLWLMLRLAWIVLQVRPDVVVTTGAAPGFLAIRLGRLVGARCVFIDSVANAERLSMSARLSLNCADATLTQWPELATEAGVQYWGTVL